MQVPGQDGTSSPGSQAVDLKPLRSSGELGSGRPHREGCWPQSQAVWTFTATNSLVGSLVPWLLSRAWSTQL